MRRATCETIQIAFTYRCVECKEILHIPPTKENLKKAEHKRIIMLGEIESGAFNYFEHFPNSKSKTAKMFSKANPSILKITVGELLNKQLNDYQRTYEKGNLSISTLTGYKKITNHLLKHFSSIEIQALSAAHLEEWLFQQSLDNITLKTVNNRLILLKALVKDAFRKKLIPMNIFDEIDMKKELNKTAVKSDFVIEPFTEEEKEIIINAASGEVRNLIQFNFWAGLRTSELIALKWEDIDFENELIHIKRAKVEKEIKTTKTKAGIRKIVMLPKAKEALLAQLPLTKNCEYVFNNPNTGEAWQSSNILANAWRKVINKTSVSYRNCYQMRHTYASTLISNGEKVFWVSEQMGHENTEMIFKHYGKWIPQDAKNGYSFVGKY
jgi:integrase